MVPGLPPSLDMDDSGTFAPAFGEIVRGMRGEGYRRAPLEEGTQVHHYEILRRIGEGGMSTVYEARHIYLKRRAALKTVKAGLAGAQAAEDLLTGGGRDEIGGRFEREAQVLARLHHPGVIQVLDLGYEQNIPYIVTEWLRGSTIRDALTADGTFSPAEAMDLVEEIAAVLLLQEEKGILHRDIKPGNVFRRTNGRFLLFDYGVSEIGDEAADARGDDAYSTMDGAIVGTPAYMAPEQLVLREGADRRTDIFALGLTVWEALAGRRPRAAGRGVADIIQCVRNAIPSICDVREDVPKELDAILRTMTAIAPEERYQSATELLEDLQEFRYGGRRPMGATKGSVFIAIPFARAFESVYQTLLSPCLDLQLSPRRVDRLVYVENIWEQISREIKNAVAVIADFSSARGAKGPNPNVVTEAAHARALGKPILVITRDPIEKLPFDWRHVPAIRYRATRRGLSDLAEQLPPKLRHCMREAGSRE